MPTKPDKKFVLITAEVGKPISNFHIAVVSVSAPRLPGSEPRWTAPKAWILSF